MSARWVPFALIGLLLILQGQLWFGRGSLPSVQHLSTQLEEQRQANTRAALANSRLEAEINDLQEGLEIVEEKARAELGMVKSNEIYVQIAK
jgi:cell division protein FtsB